jgi:hypothetical protein
MKRLTCLTLLTSLAVVGPTARAEERTDLRCDSIDDFPCTTQLEGLPLRKIPAVLKVQANVTQAGLPIGEGLFTTVFVKLRRGNETLCEERFQNVRVEGSVINLEIGRHMSCELDEVIAENSDLSFQVCPGQADNCMKAIALGASPYAIKASFASIASRAHKANLAGQAHYAHRVSADRTTLFRDMLGYGYFDFSTPSAEDARSLHPDPDEIATFANSGFLSWAPARDRRALDLHVSGRRISTGQLTKLDELYLASDDTTFSGDLTVMPARSGAGLTVTARGAHVTGDSDIDGSLRVSGALTVAAGGAHVTGQSAVAGPLEIDGATRVGSGGAHVTGDSEVIGELTVTQMLEVLSGGAKVTGNSDINGTLLVHDATRVTSGGLSVSGAATIAGGAAISGRADVAGGMTVSSGGLRVSSGGLSVDAGGAEVTGTSAITGRLTAGELELAGSFRVLDGSGSSHRAFAMQGVTLVVNPDETLAEAVVRGPVRFNGPVIFDGGAVDPRQPATFVMSSGETRDLTFGGTLTVLDIVRLEGGLVGGLVVDGGTTFHDALTLPQGLTGNLAVDGGLAVHGATTFQQPVSLPAGIQGPLGVTGALSAQSLSVGGATTFTGAVSIPGGVTGAVDFGGNVTISAAGSLAVNGATTLERLTANGLLRVNGASRFDSTATFIGGISGATTFDNNMTVNGTSLFLAAVEAKNGLTVDGNTRFNGLVDFGGSFTGTTSFENVATSGTLTVSGQTIFGGQVTFSNGITGALAMSSAKVENGLTVGGAATFSGPVDFRGEVLGLGNLSAYVKSVGETRTIGLPTLTVSDNLTIEGNLSLGGSLTDLTVESLRVNSGAGTSSLGDLDVAEHAVVFGDYAANGNRFSAPRCRICFNYADVNGADLDSRKHACAQLRPGSNSGMMVLSGDVDSNDVFGLKLICDGGPSGTNVGEWK